MPSLTINLSGCDMSAFSNYRLDVDNYDGLSCTATTLDETAEGGVNFIFDPD